MSAPLAPYLATEGHLWARVTATALVSSPAFSPARGLALAAECFATFAPGGLPSYHLSARRGIALCRCQVRLCDLTFSTRVTSPSCCGCAFRDC